MSTDNVNISVHITGVVKKFRAKPDGTAWTNDEINEGLADDDLIEELRIEDGNIVEAWRKEGG
jgi:hypothetical protein